MSQNLSKIANDLQQKQREIDEISASLSRLAEEARRKPLRTMNAKELGFVQGTIANCASRLENLSYLKATV